MLIMSIYKSLLSIALLIINTVAVADEIYPSVKSENAPTLPNNFRITPQYHFSGQDDLRVSASAQFGEKSLRVMLNLLPNRPIVIFDLRRESHGYINGHAVSWKLSEPDEEGSYNFNGGMSGPEVEESERTLLEALLTGERLSFRSDKGTVKMLVKRAVTERKLVEDLGCEYVRLPVTDHHHPMDVEVDQFVSLIRSVPKNSVLHFHCAAGLGRSTSFMSMVDIMFNHHHSLSKILKKQEAMGGANLHNPAKAYPKDPVKRERAAKRLEFLEQFHKYCVEQPEFAESWSEWKAHQHTESQNG